MSDRNKLPSSLIPQSRDDLEREIAKRVQAEQELAEKVYALGKRVKELDCLFNLSNLLERGDFSLEEILQGAVDLIPPAFQYPKIACARIKLEDKEFKTTHFNDTDWKLTSNIVFQGKPKGTLEVCYLEVNPEIDDDPFLNEERRLIDAIAERLGKDIERTKTTKLVEESEKRFRTLVDNSLSGISIIQDNRIIFQNPEQEKMLGPLPRPVKLKDNESLHPDDVENAHQFYQNVISKKEQITELEFRFYHKDKSAETTEMRWAHCRASIFEYQGKEAIMFNMMDITRVKELGRIIEIQDKMASLGRVAAGIAHEIRNPLSGINIYLSTLNKFFDKSEDYEKINRIIEQIQSASNKIGSVINRVMDFSKPSTPRLVPTNLNNPIEEAISLSSVTLRKRGIMVEKDLAEDLPPYLADSIMIEEVILNLINNATEAFKKVDGDKKIGVVSSIEDYHILIKVFDSGPGVPLHKRETIFDPFYTTKEEGSGIGLSLCRRIIADHNGTLDVGDSKWGGAEFTIKLPIAKGIMEK